MTCFCEYSRTSCWIVILYLWRTSARNSFWQNSPQTIAWCILRISIWSVFGELLLKMCHCAISLGTETYRKLTSAICIKNHLLYPTYILIFYIYGLTVILLCLNLPHIFFYIYCSLWKGLRSLENTMMRHKLYLYPNNYVCIKPYYRFFTSL